MAARSRPPSRSGASFGARRSIRSGLRGARSAALLDVVTDRDVDVIFKALEGPIYRHAYGETVRLYSKYGPYRSRWPMSAQRRHKLWAEAFEAVPLHMEVGGRVIPIGDATRLLDDHEPFPVSAADLRWSAERLANDPRLDAVPPFLRPYLRLSKDAKTA